MHSIRHWISFFTGLLIFAAGLTPLINYPAAIAKFLSENVPATILIYVLAFGGLFVIVDSFFEFTFHAGVGISTLIIGLLIFGLGLVTILGDMGVITFKVGFLSSLVYQIIFLLEGLFLMIGCFIMD